MHQNIRKQDLSVDILEGVVFPHFIRFSLNIQLVNKLNLVTAYRMTATQKEIRDVIKKDIQETLVDNVKTIISEILSVNDNATNLLAKKEEIFSKLYERVGLQLSYKGLAISAMTEFVVEPDDESKAKINQIRQKKNDNATDILNKPARDLEKEKLDAEHQREIDVIRAENTKIIEKTEKITKNVNGVSDSKEKENIVKRRFCRECGEEIKHATAKFCENCGTKIN